MRAVSCLVVLGSHERARHLACGPFVWSAVSSARVKWAYAPPARISAATQIASMSSGSLAPLCNAAVVWPRMQYGHG